MALQATLQRNVIEDHIEDELKNIAKEMFGKELDKCTDKETYYCDCR